MSKIKSIDALMSYLDDIHNIKIEGDAQKRQLRNFGYYHGYKGYRFIKQPNNPIQFSNFNELAALNQFDMQLKSLFYPHIMFIETATKNYVLEIILEESKSEHFDNIYDTLLLDYKSYSTGSSTYKNAIKKRLRLRNQFYSVLTRQYSSNKQIVTHFYHNDIAVPIWAIFEVISMGEFGNFISCLMKHTRISIGNSLNLNSSCNADGKLLENIIFLLKDLRNSIAHNDIIFDARFKNGKVNRALTSALTFDTGINNITFQTIVDYLILVVYLLKNLGIPKEDLKQTVIRFNEILDNFKHTIPFNIYSKILHTDTRNKLIQLDLFISL